MIQYYFEKIKREQKKNREDVFIQGFWGGVLSGRGEWVSGKGKRISN